MLILCLIVFGVGSIFGFSLELTPSIELPFLIVITTYRGADPESVDELVTKELNSRLKTADDYTKYFGDTLTITATYHNKTTETIRAVITLDKNGSYETVLHEIATGDANCNDVLDVADVVLLQKWLLAVPDTHLPYWQLVDMNYDNRLDVFDLCLLKRALLSAKNEARAGTFSSGALPQPHPAPRLPRCR